MYAAAVVAAGLLLPLLEAVGMPSSCLGELYVCLTVLLLLLQANGVGALLHDSLRAFLKANSHSLKRHVWSAAGSPAALEAWTGTTANLQVVKVAGFLQDMVLTVSVISYLLALFVGLVVATRGWRELAALLKPKQVSKQRSRSASSGKRS